jgi:PAS domain S-box-containing protein
MNTKLFKILFIEDRPLDVDIAVRELRKADFNFEYTTVCTKTDLQNSLREFKPDLIISDFMMPSFNGMEALKISHDHDSDLPFILCTGSVNEEVAVECIKAGAIDYVTKQHMNRLPFAVKDALDKVRISKEKKAYDLLLKENEAKLQSIFSASQVGIGLVVNRKVIEVNDFFCNMVGYERKELIGKSSEILYPSTEEYIKVGKEKYGQISRNGVGAVETKFKRKDGEILNVIISSAPIDVKDLSKGVSFTVLDISERKKAIDDLKETNRSMNTLISNLHGMVYRCMNDDQVTALFLSDGTRELTGYNPEDFSENKKITLKEIIHKDDQKYVWEEINAAINNRKHYELTYRIITKSGDIRWVSEKGEGIFAKNGKLDFLEGFITDITAQHNIEESLRMNEEKYHQIFDNIQDVYYETAIDGKILELSPSIEILTRHEYRADDLIGRSMYDFYFDSEERQLIIQQLKEKGSVADFEVTLKDQNGSTYPCSVSAKLLFDKNGVPEKIIGSMRDVTDRKNASNALKLAKEKAEISDRLKTDFLNNISHEVRTPLNGILGFAEILSLNDLSPQEKKDSYEMLFESSNRLLNTITNYMDISIITSGSLTINKRNFSPATLLRKLFDDFKPVCSNRGLDLLIEIPENYNDHNINSDPEICRKIITHFLDNAVKFTEKGKVNFGINRIDGQLEIYVKDTGIGINADSFDVIFDRFVKDTHGSSGKTEGSGLGLSIARGMSDAIGGKITVKSEPLVGSCFCLSIPVAETEEEPVHTNPEKVLKKSSNSSPILVAEDDETNFYYLNTLLVRETSSQILHASNGAEAVKLFKENPGVKLILMDMKMPEMDGFEATRQIKKISKDVHIIAITAYAMSGDEDKVIAAGCDEYLSKPINRKSLLDKIGEFIKESPAKTLSI